jgi:hypothetical protein
MFSYQNKVVGVKITGQAGSDLFDILINSGYVGSTTGSSQGDGAYLVGSADSSLKLSSVRPILSGGCPIAINWSFDDDCSQSTGYSLLQQNPIGNFYYDLQAAIYNFSLVKSGANPWVLKIGETTEVTSTLYNSGSPYGSYTDYEGDYSLSIYQDYSTSEESYYFSELILNEGSNQLCFINNQNNGIANKLYYEIGLYELSGSYLVNPSIVGSGEINPTTGADQCISFDLAYPTPGGSINLFQFDPTFSVDTGNLNQIFTGSGVHLQKDATFFFDILDQQLNTVSSDQQFLDNPLIGGCVFDILNIDGTTAAANFFTGKYSRSVTVSALDNENIFGTYKKDFGIRCRLPNSFDGSIFTGVFLAYGNVPNILDIVPNYSEFSGASQATESLNISIVLQNDLRFTQMDRYDVYASTGAGSAVNELTYLNPTAQEGYLFSQSVANVSNAYALTINKGALTENTPYYFTVVPYGALGSGKSFVFGPTTFVTKQTNVVLSSADVNAVNIYDGTGFNQTIYQTGKLCYGRGVIHEFDSGVFTSVKYLVEIKDTGNIRRLSELKGVINTTGLALIQEPVNDTSSTYQLTGLAGGLCGLYVSGSNYTGATYKLQGTMF